MYQLPQDAVFHKRTPEFSETNVPAGLLGRHTTAEGTWGKIVVLSGRLRFRFLEPVEKDETLDAEHPGVVAPQRAHQVALDGPVKFFVEFYRAN